MPEVISRVNVYINTEAAERNLDMLRQKQLKLNDSFEKNKAIMNRAADDIIRYGEETKKGTAAVQRYTKAQEEYNKIQEQQKRVSEEILQTQKRMTGELGISYNELIRHNQKLRAEWNAMRNTDAGFDKKTSFRKM